MKQAFRLNNENQDIVFRGEARDALMTFCTMAAVDPEQISSLIDCAPYFSITEEEVQKHVQVLGVVGRQLTGFGRPVGRELMVQKFPDTG